MSVIWPGLARGPHLILSGSSPRCRHPPMGDFPAGYGLPSALTDQCAGHSVARVMHSGVHPGVRHRRREEPQRQSEPGLIPADGRGEANPDAA
jgi:hypothetical protein